MRFIFKKCDVYVGEHNEEMSHAADQAHIDVKTFFAHPMSGMNVYIVLCLILFH